MATMADLQHRLNQSADNKVKQAVSDALGPLCALLMNVPSTTEVRVPLNGDGVSLHRQGGDSMFTDTPTSGSVGTIDGALIEAKNRVLAGHARVRINRLMKELAPVLEQALTERYRAAEVTEFLADFQRLQERIGDLENRAE